MSNDTHVPSNQKVSKKNRRHFKYRSNKCLNCSQPLDLSDVYCPYCSQLNTTKQLSLKDFFSEFFNSIVSYDSRLRYTIADLLFRPGTITKKYVEGKRLKYANPFRFFLSVSIIYFLLTNLISTIAPNANPFVDINDNTEKVEEAAQTLAENAENLPPEVQAVLADSIQEAVQKQIKEKQKDTVKGKKTKKKTFETISEESLDTINWGESVVKRFMHYNEFYEYSDIKDASVALDSMGHKNTSYNRWFYSKNKTIERIKEDPYGFVDYLSSKIPFFLFFFTPFFAFFFWLIYSKKKHTYVEHMIFIFHIFSFLFLAMLIALLPDTFIGNEVFAGILFTIIGPFYFYKALRNFYKQNRLVTIIKFIFLNIVFFISANITAVLFFTVSAAVY